MARWPHKCTGWKASESDPSFCANCGNIASGHKGPTPEAPRQFCLSVPVKAATTTAAAPLSKDDAHLLLNNDQREGGTEGDA